MNKKCLFCSWVLFLLCGSVAQAQERDAMFVAGNTLYDACGAPLVMQGVNHAPYNWGWSPDYNVFPEIAKTGSNTVRIVWYSSQVSGGGAPAYANLAQLDSAIARCAAAKMVPVLELHDHTCMNDSAQFINLMSFYTQPAMLDLINRHRKYLVINLANEALYVMWGGSVQRYINIYTRAIGMLRNEGIHVPLMIDAPDCGQHLDVFQQAGMQLKNADVDTNLIFSAHAYWSAYANNMDSLSVRAKLQAAENTGLCYVLGEVANRQSDGNNECAYTLSYGALLRVAREMQIGYLVWSWDNDVCAPRSMSQNGMFNQLTPFGSDMVNNPDYGLLQSERSAFLQNGMQCLPGTGMEAADLKPDFAVARTEGGMWIHSFMAQDAVVQLVAVDGRVLYSGQVGAQGHLYVQDQWPGIKIVRIRTGSTQFVQKVF